MRSKILKRILDETPEDVREKVRVYGDALVRSYNLGFNTALAGCNKPVVSVKRLTEIIHKAVDETYATVDSYVNEYIDSTYDEKMAELNSLKDELSKAACDNAKGEEPQD